jgi:hypothetical protein
MSGGVSATGARVRIKGRKGSVIRFLMISVSTSFQIGSEHLFLPAYTPVMHYCAAPTTWQHRHLHPTVQLQLVLMLRHSSLRPIPSPSYC